MVGVLSKTIVAGFGGGISVVVGWWIKDRIQKSRRDTTGEKAYEALKGGDEWFEEGVIDVLEQHEKDIENHQEQIQKIEEEVEGIVEKQEELERRLNELKRSCKERSGEENG